MTNSTLADELPPQVYPDSEGGLVREFIEFADFVRDKPPMQKREVSVRTICAVAAALRTPPTSTDEAERAWPEIGVEPLTLPRPRDIEETKARLREAMVTQQPHVPNGTALVWRTDLLDTHHRAIRFEALAELRAEKIAALTAIPTSTDERKDVLAILLDIRDTNHAVSGKTVAEVDEWYREQAVAAIRALTPNPTIDDQTTTEALGELSDFADRASTEMAALYADRGRLASDKLQLQAQVERLSEALTPSGDTKAAYHGEFSFIIKQAQEDEDGEAIEVDQRVYVPWTTVKEIMAAIRARAALTTKGD